MPGGRPPPERVIDQRLGAVEATLIGERPDYCVLLQAVADLERFGQLCQGRAELRTGAVRDIEAAGRDATLSAIPKLGGAAGSGRSNGICVLKHDHRRVAAEL